MVNNDNHNEDNDPRVFNRFIDNTQTTCIITGIGLLIIVWSFIGPGKYMFGSTIGKLIGLIVLIYAAYSCFSSTNTLIKNKEDIFKNPKFVVERNNVLLSYGFGLLLVLLCLYIVKQIIW